MTTIWQFLSTKAVCLLSKTLNSFSEKAGYIKICQSLGNSIKLKSWIKVCDFSRINKTVSEEDAPRRCGCLICKSKTLQKHRWTLLFIISVLISST